MIAYDHRGVPLTVSDHHELDRVEKCLIGILGMDDDPSVYWQRSANESGSVALVVTECIDLVSSMELEKMQRAALLIEPYRSASLQMEMSDRDRLLTEAIAKWVNREFVESHRLLTQIVDRYPKDMLSVFASHMLEFHMGWTQQMHATIQKVLPEWAETDSLYGYLKGIEAFCLEENGFYEEALQAAEAALWINPRDIYAVHAVCHCFYETGRFEQGIAWMEETMPHWQDNKFMRIHVWWHYALFKLYLLDFERVQEVYQTRIRKKNNPTGLEDLDAASLLWRLNLLGGDAGYDWRELLECWGSYEDTSSYWFNDFHALLVFAANGELERASSLMEHSLAHNCTEPIGDIVRHAFAGICLFGEGNYRQAYLTIQNILRPYTAFGGSHAQRDILEMTAIEAALRANDQEAAKSLIDHGRCFRYDSPLKETYLTRIEKTTFI